MAGTLVFENGCWKEETQGKNTWPADITLGTVKSTVTPVTPTTTVDKHELTGKQQQQHEQQEQQQQQQHHHHSGVVRFVDVMYYYPNMIDYVRVAMILGAAFAIHDQMASLAACLILSATLLDWVDGAVARAYNQCTIIGCGFTWLADVLAQIVTMVWWSQLDPSVQPWLMVITSIEIATALCDFGITATGRYPKLERKRGFMIILDWCMRNTHYSWFGEFVWLSYPVFAVASCLYLSWTDASPSLHFALWLCKRLLFVPTLLYCWCELAYLFHIMGHWNEPGRTARKTSIYNDGPRGFENCGTVPKAEQELISGVYDQLQQSSGRTWGEATRNRDIYWFNLWQLSSDGSLYKGIDGIERMHKWAQEMVKEHFAGEDVVLDGYGFITNPVGSKTQHWHLDYSVDYATLFIPVTRITAENATQYCVVPPSVPSDLYQQAIKDLDNVNINMLVDAGHAVSIRQLLAPPFTIVKMQAGTIHRGITNRADYDRVVFWISVRNRTSEALPTEPSVTVIPESIGSHPTASAN